jgi:hypothetical protein
MTKTLAADVITFEIPFTTYNVGDSFNSNGYVFTQQGQIFDFGTTGQPVNCIPLCVGNGTFTYMNFNDSYFTFTRADNEPFLVSQLDVAGTFVNWGGDASGILVTGYMLGGGEIQQMFVLADADHFTTFYLSQEFQSHLYGSVDIRGLPSAGPDSSQFSVDNIVTNNEVSQVPEPASMVLLGTGLIGLAGRQSSKKLHR